MRADTFEMPPVAHIVADLDEIERVFGGDPFKYGMEAGRHNFEAFMQYMAEQGIIHAPLAVDDLFADVGRTDLS